ncbi:MAG: hypothetical protein WC307_00555 [Candidatus Nanoarchaeia archaeon]
MNFDEYDKIKGIIKLKEWGLPTPSTLFVNNHESQKEEVNNFLMNRELVMVRSERLGQSTNCPRKLKCSPYEAREFISKLNNDGYVAIVQDYVPLNNKYSGNILVFTTSIIIEAMHGGPVSKLNREGIMHEHIRLGADGRVLIKHGQEVIPYKELLSVLDKLKGLPIKNHIIEFSAGPDWLYFWHVREDKTSNMLE